MQQTTNDPTFQDFLIETREVISSRDFAHVLEVALDRATAILFESLEKNVFVNGSLSEGGTSGRGGATTPSGGDNEIRLAGLLPCLARWCHLALNGLPNELIDVRLVILKPDLLDIFLLNLGDHRDKRS